MYIRLQNFLKANHLIAIVNIVCTEIHTDVSDIIISFRKFLSFAFPLSLIRPADKLKHLAYGNGNIAELGLPCCYFSEKGGIGEGAGSKVRFCGRFGSVSYFILAQTDRDMSELVFKQVFNNLLLITTGKSLI